jgi:hypothetical protein
MKNTGPWKWVTASGEEGLFLVDSNDYVVLSCDQFYANEELDLIKAAPVMQKALSDIVKVLRFYVRHEQPMRTDTLNDLLVDACAALASAEGWE